MLQTQTVEPHTFSILKKLMEMPELQGFSLVSGTALSLLYGHRISIDLDLFSNQPFENNDIVIALQKAFGNKFDNRSTNPKFGVFCFIENVKVDIVHNPHPNIFPQFLIDDIRMFSKEDLVAMMVQAVLGRGKKKDFWDIAELLNDYSIDDFINFHKQKYSTQNLLITVPQVITYFTDAHESEDPVSLKNQSWEKVQQIIKKKVSDYLT